MNRQERFVSADVPNRLFADQSPGVTRLRLHESLDPVLHIPGRRNFVCRAWSRNAVRRRRTVRTYPYHRGRL